MALKALAEPRRQQILRLVWTQERTAGDIAAHFDISRPAISQHLKVLKESGLVGMRREGTRRLYRASQDHLGAIGPMLEATWATAPAARLVSHWAPELD